MVIAAGVAAAVSVAGTVASGVLSSSAASSAASKQSASATLSAQEQQGMYNQNQINQSDFLASGQTANQTLDQLFGLNPTGGPSTYDQVSPQGQALTELEGLSGVSPNGPGQANSAFNSAYSAFQNSPTYQFQLQQGQQALDRSAASKGLLLSGAQLKDSQAFGQGLASQSLGQFTSNLQNLYGNLYQGIAGQASLGQNAAAGLGNNGVQSSSQIGQSLQNAGNAQASGIVGSNNATTQGFQNALGALSGNNSSYGGLGNNLQNGWNSLQNQYQFGNGALSDAPAYQSNGTLGTTAGGLGIE